MNNNLNPLTGKQKKKRDIEREEYIINSQNPVMARRYAYFTIGGRWPEAEEFIKKDNRQAYEYAKDVIKGRWPEAEETIKKSNWRFSYIKNVIKGRWPEAEEYIKKNPLESCNYAKYIIKGRWPEAEEYIKKDFYSWSNYLMLICHKCKGDGIISLGIGGAEEECFGCGGSGFDPAFLGN